MAQCNADLAALGLAELTAAGCGTVYREKVSGAKTERAELAKVTRRAWSPATCPLNP